MCGRRGCVEGARVWKVRVAGWAGLLGNIDFPRVQLVLLDDLVQIDHAQDEIGCGAFG